MNPVIVFPSVIPRLTGTFRHSQTSFFHALRVALLCFFFNRGFAAARA
jgi:hypothetical protein